MSYPSDEVERQMDGWDPDEAKKEGSLKLPLDFKANVVEVDMTVQLEEPKLAVKTSKKPKIVKTGQRNKNELF